MQKPSIRSIAFYSALSLFLYSTMSAAQDQDQRPVQNVEIGPDKKLFDAKKEMPCNTRRSARGTLCNSSTVGNGKPPEEPESPIIVPPETTVFSVKALLNIL